MNLDLILRIISRAVEDGRVQVRIERERNGKILVGTFGSKAWVLESEI